MAIHASKFSSKSSPSKPKPVIKFPKFKLGRILLIVGIVIAVLLIVRVGWELVSGLPTLPGETNYPKSTNYGERANILLASLDDQDVRTVALASVGKDRIEFINLDPNWLINTPQGRGEYRLGSVVKLGDLGSGNGINLLRDSVSRLLAVPVDGYIVTTPDKLTWLQQRFGPDAASVGQKVTSQRWQLALGGFNMSGIYSSFNRLQLLKISSLLDRTTPIEVPAMNRYFGSSFDSDAFDNDVGTRMSEQAIARNRPRVSIVNASGVAGAATEVARYVHNLGGEVDLVDSANSAQVKTIIIDHTGTPLATRLAGLLRTSVQYQSTKARTDLEITLGQDIALFF